jgi:phage gp46-like protein
MADVKLSYNSDSGEFDINIANGDFELDDSLETSVIISLFTDKQSWWADETLPDEDSIGSLLYTLKNKTITNDLLNKMRTYALDSLSWLLIDGVAKSVDVTVTRVNQNRVDLNVVITKPDNLIFKYKLPWDSLR